MGAASQQRPCRITMFLPNKDAKDLFITVKQEVYKDVSCYEKYGCFSCCAITGAIFLVTGIWAFVQESEKESIIYGGVAFVVLTLIGVLCQLSCRNDAPIYAQDEHGINKCRKAAAVELEARMKDALTPWKKSIEALEHAPQIARMSSLNDCLNTLFPSYADMNYAGCVPKSAMATYAVAWTVLSDHYKKNNLPVYNKLQVLHEKWENLIVKATKAASKVTWGIDQQRLKRTQRALSQAVDQVVGVTGIFDTVETLKSLHDLKGELDDLRQTLKETERIKSDSLEPRTGLHAITKHSILWYSVLVTVLCAPFIGTFAAVGSPEGAWAMGVFLIVFLVAFWCISAWFTASYNALEDLYDFELYLRQSIRLVIEKNPTPNQNQLCAATNELRDLVMDAYYDTLALHIQTEILTFGNLPPTDGEPTPLFWSNKVFSSGRSTQHTADPSVVPDDTKVAVPPAPDEPDIELGEITTSYSAEYRSSGRQPSSGLSKPFSGITRMGAPPPMDEDEMPSNPHLAAQHPLTSPAVEVSAEREFGSA